MLIYIKSQVSLIVKSMLQRGHVFVINLRRARRAAPAAQRRAHRAAPAVRGPRGGQAAGDAAADPGRAEAAGAGLLAEPRARQGALSRAGVRRRVHRRHPLGAHAAAARPHRQPLPHGRDLGAHRDGSDGPRDGLQGRQHVDYRWVSC